MILHIKNLALDYLHWIKINLFITIKQIRPENFVINGKVTFNRGSYLKFDKNSLVKLEGTVVIKKSKLILTNSIINLNNTECSFSNIVLSNSGIITGEKSHISYSSINLYDSKLNTGTNFNSHSFSVHMSNNSVLTANEYFMLAGTNKPSGLTLSACTFTADSNNRIEAEVLASNSSFTMGSGNFLNSGTSIRCMEKISMGNNNFVSYDCVIFDTNTHATNSELRVQEIANGFPNQTRQTELNKPKTKPIQIGNCTWIGMRTAILKGAVIGDGAIVALYTVVTGNVPTNNIAYGNPYQLRTIQN